MDRLDLWLKDFVTENGKWADDGQTRYYKSNDRPLLLDKKWLVASMVDVDSRQFWPKSIKHF